MSHQPPIKIMVIPAKAVQPIAQPLGSLFDDIVFLLLVFIVIKNSYSLAMSFEAGEPALSVAEGPRNLQGRVSHKIEPEDFSSFLVEMT